MTLANYQVRVWDVKTGDLTRIYDAPRLYSLRYSRMVNDIGSLVATFPGDDAIQADFPLDTLIEVQRTSPVSGRLTTEATYLMRLVERVRSDNEERLIIGAQHANHLLKRRVIDPDDDPLAAGGYSTKSGAADSVMREYALEQCGSSASAARQFPNFTIDTVAGVGQNVGRRLRHDNLFKVIQELADQGGVDFRIVQTSANNLELKIARLGTDRTKARNYPVAPFVMLNPLRGNLSNPTLRRDRKKEANFCYGLGQGANEQRIVLKQAGDGMGDSPYNRIEFTKDVRLSERGNSLEILTQVRDALADKATGYEFEFDLSGDTPGAIYNQDWFLGDQVTVAWAGVEQDVRITGVEINIGPEGERISVTTEAD